MIVLEVPADLELKLNKNVFLKIRLSPTFNSLTVEHSSNAIVIASLRDEHPQLYNYQAISQGFTYGFIDDKCTLEFNVGDFKRGLDWPNEEQFLYLAVVVRIPNDGESVAFSLYVKETESQKLSRDENSENVQVCDNCKRPIPKQSFVLHQLHCARTNTLCTICNVSIQNSFKSSHWHCCKSSGLIPETEELHRLLHQVKCVCGLEFSPVEGSSHWRECVKRLIRCRFCHLNVEAGPFSTLPHDLLMSTDEWRVTQHESECGSRTEVCDKCGKNITLKDFDKHLGMHKLMKKYKPKPFIVCSNFYCSNPNSQSNKYGLCNFCYGPFYSPNYEEESVKQKKFYHKLIRRYFSQLSEGCKQPECRNEKCHVNYKNTQDATETAIIAIKLSNEGVNSEIGKFWFCTNIKNQQIKLGALSLCNLGYDIEWCIEALKNSYQKKQEQSDREVEEEEGSVSFKITEEMMNSSALWLQREMSE